MSDTYVEIHDQPVAWATAIPDVIDQWTEIAGRIYLDADTHLLFVGSGSSLYLCQTAARCFQQITGHVCRAVASSEVFLAARTTVPYGYPVVAFVVSRSGSTTEALLAARYLTEDFPNAQVVALSCGLGTDLEKRAHHIITLPYAGESSVVMTKSFTTMLLALLVVAAQIAGDEDLLTELKRLPALLSDQFDNCNDFGKAVGSDLQQNQFIYLGLGPNSGLAEEGTLKLKEMTQTPCEAYGPLELRHGPISIVGEGTSVVILESFVERAYLPDLEADLKRQDALIAAISPYESAQADVILKLPPDLSDIARCLLYVPPLQLLAYHRALVLGLDPDRPRHLSPVVVLPS